MKYIFLVSTIILLFSFSVFYLSHEKKIKIKDKLISFIIRHSSIIVGCLLSFGFILPYLFVPFGLDFTDTFYSLNNYKQLQASEMMPLSHYLGNIIYKICNGELLYIRIVGTFIYQLIIIIPIIFLLPWRKYILQFSALFALLSVFLTMTNSHIFCYDNFSSLFIITTFIFYVKYIQNNNYLNLVLLSIFAGFSVLCRFPNVVMVVFVIILLSVNAFAIKFKSKELFLKLIFDNIIFLTLTIFTTFLVKKFIDSQIAVSLSENVMSTTTTSNSHSLSILLNTYWRHITEVFGYINLFTTLIISISYFIELKQFIKFKPFLYGLIFLSLFGWVFTHSYFLFNISFILSSYLIILLMIGSYKEFKTKKSFSFVILAVSIFFFSLISAAGSNTGLLKMTNYVFFPFVLYFTWPYLSKSVKSFTLILFAVLVVYAPFAKKYFTFQDAGIFKTTTSEIKSSKLKHIYTTPERTKFVNDIIHFANVAKLNNKSYLFVGNCGQIQIFEFILGFKRSACNTDFNWVPGDKGYNILVSDYLKTNKENYIIFIVDYPENDKNNSYDIETSFVKMNYKLELIDKGYRIYKLLDN